MGNLIRLGKASIHEYTNKNGELCQVRTGNYTNKNAIENLIRYITRTRPNEDRLNDLKGWGARGVLASADIETIISQFTKVQQILRGSNVIRHMYHFVYQFDEVESKYIGNDYSLAGAIAHAQSMIFFQMGYQTVYAIHDDPEKRMHLHFAVNSVNSQTALMLHLSHLAETMLSEYMTNISYHIIATTRNKHYPIIMDPDFSI